jgi:hypothetical protein
LSGNPEAEDIDELDANTQEDDDGADVAGPLVFAEVTLAKVPSKHYYHYILNIKVIDKISAAVVTVDKLAQTLSKPDIIGKRQSFVTDQTRADSESDLSFMDASDDQPPAFDNLITLYPSAVSTYFAPSDLCGIGGMHSKRIRATPDWRKEGPRYDTIFVNTNPNEDGMCGLDVAHVKQFFSFKSQGCLYPCAIVQWYSCHGDEPDEDTGMWIVEPDVQDNEPITEIIHLDTIVRSAHLIAVYGNNQLPQDIPLCYTLDLFRSYYVNKYIDHHAFELAF